MTTIFFVIVPPPLVGAGLVGFGVVGCGVLVDFDVEVDVDVEVLVEVGVLVGSEVVVSSVGVVVVGVAEVTVVGVGVVRVLGGTDRDELGAEDTDGADGAEDTDAAEDTEDEEAEELRPGTVMLGEPVEDGAAALETADGRELGTGSAVVEVPQLLRTTVRARAEIRAAGTTRTRMGPECQPGPAASCRKHACRPYLLLWRSVPPFGRARMGVSRMQPGMPDLAQIVLKAQQMGDAVQRAQAALAEQVFTGTAGGNLVRAEVTGDGELTAVSIDPSAVDPDDVETLGDLIVAAVRDAQRQVAEERDAIVGDATGGFDLDALGLGDMGLPQPPPAPGER